MRSEDKRRFMRGMEKLRNHLPSSIRLTEKQEAIRLDDFWEILKDFSIQSFERAVERALREFHFFPVPGDMIELCNEEADRRRAAMDVPLLEHQEQVMTKEEAMAALQKIFDRLPYGSMTDEQIEQDKKRVGERKAFLKEQEKHLLFEEGKEDVSKVRRYRN